MTVLQWLICIVLCGVAAIFKLLYGAVEQELASPTDPRNGGPPHDAPR